MKRKINQVAANTGKAAGSKLYEKNREIYEFLLNPDTGVKEKEELYIPDSQTVSALQEILKQPMDSITNLIGYPGIGKTSDIKYSFSVKNGVPKLLEETRTVVLFCPFDGYIRQASSPGETETAIELAKRVSAVCTMLEDRFPLLREQFYSTEGEDSFLKFIQQTNPQALESLCDSRPNTSKEYLDRVKKHNHFVYAASRLKYYLSRSDIPYERVLIIVDNLESQSAEEQEQILAQYFRLYTCLRNFPEEMDKRVYVNLLTALRPETYYRIKAAPFTQSHSMKDIFKNKRIDLASYFRKKAASLPAETWGANASQYKEAENTLFAISEKFDKKYSNMIMGLVNMNVCAAMNVLKDILSKSPWVRRDACIGFAGSGTKDGYVFNNITVIRAIACGANLVYLNGQDQLIPNILYNTETEDNSIISLYILSYFIKRGARFMEYDGRPVLKSELIQDFCDVFKDVDDIENRVTKTLDYLLSHRILVPSSPASSGPPCLSLSSAGMEIWNMLESDSVLMELYREDYFQECAEKDSDQFKSSYGLMQKNNQEKIFIELYNILTRLFVHEEKPLIEAARKCRAMGKYESLFQEKTVTEHLMKGVDCSVAFSGKQLHDGIAASKKQLIDQINALQ